MVKCKTLSTHGAVQFAVLEIFATMSGTVASIRYQCHCIMHAAGSNRTATCVELLSHIQVAENSHRMTKQA